MDTVTVYLDEDFMCHAEPGEGRTAYETEFFVGQEELIPLYRIVPPGMTWTRADGEVFRGEMISPK
ncbi:MAG: hypothetical protein ABFC31_12500 [Clostridiaceae bacterium]